MSGIRRVTAEDGTDGFSDYLSISSLAKALHQDGIIRKEQLGNLLITEQHSNESHPITFIASRKLRRADNDADLSLEFLLHWLANKSHLSSFHIDPLKIDSRKCAAVMSLAFAQRHKILAVEVEDDSVRIASSEPFVSDWVDDLRHVLKKRIERVIADPVLIGRYTNEFYQLANTINQATDTESGNANSFEQLMELGSSGDGSDEQHIGKVVDWLLEYAFQQAASDIHIEPRKEATYIRFRIDGKLHQVYDLPSNVGLAALNRLKILARMNIAEKRKPQDGRIKTKNLQAREIELRLATLPTVFGEKLVVRIFDPQVIMKSFRALGFNKEDQGRWINILNHAHGMVLVTGPTGSGKTTTLYSSLKRVAKPDVNVCTIEDPIEMVEPSFNQMQVQHSIDLNFASGVRAMLRQDPDIIMIGEIRDQETAEMAFQAALTGHLVFATLHTNDAPSAITRLIELNVPPYIIRATLRGVMAQRLARKNCDVCKVPTKIAQETWESFIAPWKSGTPRQPTKGKGCATCRNTGYRGRLGLYEILQINQDIAELIDHNTDLKQIRRIASQAAGMRTLRLSGAQKVSEGLTTIEEVMRVTSADN